ncbi:hypothetical protein RvY_17283 [Ramazzottius varieornatus]|uniref:Uncharacterized protein n=1 Tax=Ramazzottius varieornatus TaxID=947166 RepID=A0A1D1W1K7_RAMVA|nr:hypothetical protein RvY_17283 [Ramazzottius varieornatus]
MVFINGSSQMAHSRTYGFLSLVLAVISCGGLFVSAEAQPQYLNSITQVGVLPIQIRLCPNLHARYGLFALNPPGTWYNVTPGINDNLEIVLTIVDNSTCVEPGQRYAFHINIRSFRLTNDRPVFQVGMEDPLNSDVDKRPDMRRLRNYTLGYMPHPRAELQYLSDYSSRPALATHIRLLAEKFDGVHAAVEMEYTVLQEYASNHSDVTHHEVAYCGALHGYIPRELYCLDHISSYLACPKECDEERSNGFQYGSCGREREAQKCGEHHGENVLFGNSNQIPEGELNFILGWDVLAGIIAGGVILFVLVPMIILMVAYNRGKQRR